MTTNHNQTNAKKRKFSSLKDILEKYDIDNQGKYITREFQDYGYRLAMELGDADRVGMYIKLAKTMDRTLLETAKNFVKDARNVKHKGRLFLWKVGQLKKEKKS